MVKKILDTSECKSLTIEELEDCISIAKKQGATHYYIDEQLYFGLNPFFKFIQFYRTKSKEELIQEEISDLREQLKELEKRI
jgi:ribosomal protein L29